MRLEMATPEKTTLESSAEFVVLPAHGGEMGVLPGHEPFWVELKAGEVRVTEPGGAVKHYAVGGGFAEVLQGKVSVFAESSELAEEIDAERARQSLERARAQALRRDVDPVTLAAAEAAMRRAAVRLRVAELRVRRAPRPSPPDASRA